jgi:hypothetical protein
MDDNAGGQCCVEFLSGAGSFEDDASPYGNQGSC